MTLPDLRSLTRMPRLILGFAFASTIGCAAHTQTLTVVAPSERAAPASMEVSDDAFAAAVHDLLVSDPGTAERGTRLRAVESRQMVRASARFKSHSIDRGLAALTGGLFLVHVGEFAPGLLGSHGAEALTLAAKELAGRGDEGRARAVYDLLMQVVPENQRTERADLRAHLQALDHWTQSAVASSAGPVATAGAIERVAVRRRLLEPSDTALSDAARATTEWVQRAAALRDKSRNSRQQPPREETVEAWRALETGPLVLAALYLRDANIKGAVAALDRAQARELFESDRPQLAAALSSAAQDPTAARCVELLAQLRPLTAREPGRDEQDDSDDRDLFGAAAFAVAGECYRLDPTAPQVALGLVVALDDLGMAEATPAIVVQAFRAHPEAAFGSEVLGLSLAAMAREEDAGDAEAARRTFRAAQPLFAIASQKALVGKLRPSPARLRAAMGDIELHEGRIDPARALLKQSVDEEPFGSVLMSLARIEWRDGQTPAAIEHLGQALAAPDAATAPALRGEILLTLSDVLRDKGDVAAARASLTDALRGLVAARNTAVGDERARVERALARVLVRFGAIQPALRALDRAYAAAPGDKRQAAQTIELLVGGAFVRGDMASARDGFARALATDLDSEDLVYFALWVRLLERQLHVPTDGAPDRVFATIPDDGRWVSTLAHFGDGHLKGDELVARAATVIQKYEALFYAGLDHRALGDARGGDTLLRQVVAGTGLELTEVALARDLLDAGRPLGGGPLPPDVAIP